jgi:uncharacterized protein (DUF952 family)
MRWLYHALLANEDVGDPYAPASLASEGFVHASFADAVHETIALYFPREAPLVVWQIDPRALGGTVDVVETPRGPMPHIIGAIPRRAVRATWAREALPRALPDTLESDLSSI